MKKLERLKIAKNYYPNASLELNYNTIFQLLTAVMLSAQTTDIAVNKATSELFKKYKEAKDFDKITYDEIYPYLKNIGLAKTKTKNLIKLAHQINKEYNGIVPNKREELIKLAGVGQKTANVVLANAFNQQYIAVDTHIERICKRLVIVPEKYDVVQIENTLVRILKDEDLSQYHHSLVFFGRYHCKAKKPNCNNCKLQKECRYYRKIKLKEGNK